MKNLKKQVSLCAATFFYVGLIPYSPGTMGSVAATILFYVLPINTWWLWGIMSLMLFIVGLWSSNEMERNYSLKDPSWIVIDEALGMCCILCFIPRVAWMYVLALALFRFFDILKPFPISWFERNVTGGLGVMIDDVVAALMALGVIKIIFFLLP